MRSQKCRGGWARAARFVRRTSDKRMRALYTCVRSWRSSRAAARENVKRIRHPEAVSSCRFVIASSDAFESSLQVIDVGIFVASSGSWWRPWVVRSLR